MATIDGLPNVARHDDEICIVAYLFNTCDDCCTASGVNTDVVLGDGTTVAVTRNAVLYTGDKFICPSADPRCITPSNCTIPGQVGYRFVISHSDEHGSTGVSCPPDPEPGYGEEHVLLLYDAVAHMDVDNALGLCRVSAVKVYHDCDELCPEGQTCLDGVCQPSCNDDGRCDAGEDCTTCPSDCPGVEYGCGNGTCEIALDENCVNCPADCNGSRSGKRIGFCCGASDGKRGRGCDDSRCNSRGFACSNESVASCCGDSLCDSQENSCNCPTDCGPAVSAEDPALTCENGLDDDCDGVLDASDPDCPCLSAGEACVDHASCCSGLCSQRGICN